MEKTWRMFALGLFVILFLAGGTQSAAASPEKEPSSAQSAEEKHVLDATVNLYCSIKIGNRTISTTGTGVFIHERGIILTNAHVGQYFLFADGRARIKSNCAVRTGSPARASYKAEVLHLSPEWAHSYAGIAREKKQKGTGEHDFALLYVSGASGKGKTLPERFPFLSLDTAGDFSEGDTVLAAGYPAEKLDFKKVRNALLAQSAEVTIESIRTFSSGRSDVLALSPSDIARSGVSGGPIVKNDSVIGIAATMGTAKEKNLASLRGITSTYIGDSVQSETGATLADLYKEDLAVRASITKAIIASSTLGKSIEKGLRKIRR